MPGSETILGISLLGWLSTYGYWVMVPLMIIEGPIVGFTAGVLTALGVFNPIGVFVAFVVASAVTDTVLYILGRYGSPILMKIPHIRAVIQAARDDMHLHEDGWPHLFKQHFTKMFFLTRITPTFSISGALVALAGVFHISPRRVALGFLLAQPFWSAAVIAFGYYFGSVITDVSYMFQVTGIILGVFGILVIVYYIFFHHTIMERAPFAKLFKILSISTVRKNTNVDIQ